jgi:predicted transcriptional regulator
MYSPMRTLVEIPDPDLKELSELASRQGQSRAALIREAIVAYLAAHRQSRAADAFGAWGQNGADGLMLQRRLRGEW